MVGYSVACIQMRSGIDIDENIAQFLELVRRAADAGARYIQTPEMTGIVQRDRKVLFSSIKSEQNDPLLEKAADLAGALNVWLHVGSTALSITDGIGATKAVNRGVLFSPQGLQHSFYDKINLFDVQLAGGECWNESSLYQSGNRAVVVDMGDFMLGMAICYDLRFPHLYRMQAQAGATILTCPAAFTHQTGEKHWEILLRARAIETGSFMIAAAQGGLHEDGRHTYGHSMIVDPWGNKLAEIDGDEPDILVCDLNLAMAEEARTQIPNLVNERPFKLKLSQ